MAQAPPGLLYVPASHVWPLTQKHKSTWDLRCPGLVPDTGDVLLSGIFKVSVFVKVEQVGWGKGTETEKEKENEKVKQLSFGY